MSFKIVMAPYVDPAAGKGDWPDQTPELLTRIESRVANAPDGAPEFRLAETDHGIGADWPTITLEIVTLVGGLFFSIPATHKLIRETVEEWKKIAKSVRKLIDWLSETETPVSYSVEVAFLAALDHLDGSTSVGDLELLSIEQIHGKSNTSTPSFDRSELSYYVFSFREHDERALILIYDSRLNRLASHILELDPRALIK